MYKNYWDFLYSKVVAGGIENYASGFFLCKSTSKTLTADIL
jgi:hypothetical protein